MKSNPCNHTECQKHYRDVRLWDVWALIVYPVIVAVALVAARPGDPDGLAGLGRAACRSRSQLVVGDLWSELPAKSCVGCTRSR